MGSLVSFGLAALIVAMSLNSSPLRLGEHRLGTGFELAAAGLGIWLAIIVVWWSRRQGRFAPFELPVWFSLNAYIQVVLNVWLLQPDFPLTSPWLASNVEVVAARVVILMGVSLTVLWGSYAWFSHRLQVQPRPARRLAGRPRWPLLFGIWAASWILEVLAVVSDVTGYLPGTISFAWTAYLEFASFLGNLATFVILLHHLRKPTWIGWLWLAFVCGSEVALGLIVGTKTAVLVFLYVVMAAYYARRRIAKSWLVAGLLALMVIVPVVNVFRINLFRAGYSTSAGASFEGRVPILVASVQDVVSRPFTDLATDTRDTFEQRQGGLLEIMAAIMTVHPRIKPYVGPEMLSYLPLQLIPRVVWPNKPAGRPDLYLIVTNYLGAPYEYSMASPGQFADAYRAGGWLFVIVWFWLLGGLMAWLYRQGPGLGLLAGTAFYLLMLNQVVTYDAHVIQLSLELLKYGVPAWLLTKYVLFEPVRGEDLAGRNLDSIDPAWDQAGSHKAPARTYDLPAGALRHPGADK